MVSAAPRRLQSRRLRWSSLARRQSPRARAFRQGRQSFFFESKLTWCDMAPELCTESRIPCNLFIRTAT